MGSETSELVMALLEELATLKELDVKPTRPKARIKRTVCADNVTT